MEILNTFILVLISVMFIINTYHLVRLVLKHNKIIDATFGKLSKSNDELIPNEDKLILFKFFKYFIIDGILFYLFLSFL
jgi:hypothetical protein